MITLVILSTVAVLLARVVVQIRSDLVQVSSPVTVAAESWPSANTVAFIWVSTLISWVLALTFNRHRIGPIQWLGFLSVVIGSSLVTLGIATLKDSYSRNLCIYQNHCLVTNGIYSVVRHPIRVGMLFETIGFSSFFFSVFAPIAPMALLIVMDIRSKREDQMMTYYFGCAAAEYQRNVPAFNVLAGLVRYAVRYFYTRF